MPCLDDPDDRLPYVPVALEPGEGGPIRREILDAAHRIVAERGYPRLTMRDVAGALGKQVGSTYRHVASKQELAFALIVESFARLYGVLEEAAAAHPADPGRAFEAACRAYVRHGLRHPRHYELMMVVSEEDLPSMPDERRVYAYRCLVLLAEIVAAAMAAGQLRADEEPPEAAAAAWALLHGATSLVVSDRVSRGDPIGPERFVEVVLGRVLRSFGVAAEA